VPQVKARVGGFGGGGQFGHEALRIGQCQLGDDLAFGIVEIGTDAGYLGQEDELVALQGNRHRGGHVFHAQVEGFAGRRKTKR
jgi:hypothetical protein